MNELVSIVIPVYNVEKYLSMCIDSVLKQTYSNLEIILVNDGSTDNSGKICDDYLKIDTRIVVFHNENSGVGSTRNFGVEHSNGKYIVFVDSDDCCRSKMIEKMIDNYEKNDNDTLIICGIDVFEKDLEIYKSYSYNAGLYKVEDYVQTILLPTKIGQFCGGPYNKLFLRDIIINNNIIFDTKATFAEDFCFNINYLKYIKQVHILDENLYLYRENSVNSLTYKNYHNYDAETYWSQRLHAFEVFEDIFYYYKLYKKNKGEINELLIRFMISSVKMQCKNSVDKTEIFEYVKKICEDEYCRQHITSVSNINKLDRIRLFLIRNRKYKILILAEKTRYVVGRKILGRNI